MRRNAACQWDSAMCHSFLGSFHVSEPIQQMQPMQVYAYTTSELQVAILRLFVRAECRLPNLFVGTLTRESVTQALDFGVQADQIISFMQQHAHPHVLHKVPIVPEVCLQSYLLLSKSLHHCFLYAVYCNCLMGHLYLHDRNSCFLCIGYPAVQLAVSGSEVHCC